MFKNFKQLFMERDGVTPCFVRCGVAVGQVAYFGLTALAIHKGQPVDYIAWSTGYTALLVGAAGGALLKLKTEGDAQ